jgi:hypothetical protein
MEKQNEKLDRLEKQNERLEKQNKEILSKINSMNIKTTTLFKEPLKTLGPKLIKINPENLKFVYIYESVAECLKESNFKIKRPTLEKCITENTVYNGFRWMYGERENEIDETTFIIPPTKVTTPKNVGYIAKLNKEKTEIVNVYIDRKTASLLNGYISASALDNPVKNGVITKENYYILYENCAEKLKTDFVVKNGGAEPLLYRNGVGEFDSNNVLTNVYMCKYDCIKKLVISDKTFAKILDKNIAYNSRFYRIIENKEKCF